MAEWLNEMSVGDWFAAGPDRFEVVGIDPAAEIVLVQHYDGSLDEFDFDSWAEIDARPIPPPEDLSGALDAERDAFGFSDPSREHRPTLDALDWIQSHDL